MEDCEEPEWTIFSETLTDKGRPHCGVTTGDKSNKNGMPGGRIQQKPEKREWS